MPSSPTESASRPPHRRAARRALIIWTVLTVALTAAVILAPAARAATPATVSQVRGPMLAQALAVADRFWNDRGVPGCTTSPHVFRLIAVPDEEFAGFGNPDNCTVELDRSYANEAIRFPDRWQLAELCGMVAHEEGHARGQDHVDDPTALMNKEIGPDNSPAACKSWGRRWERRLWK